MRHFSAFLQNVREMRERAGGFEAEVHYARLDAVLNTLGHLQATLTYRELGEVLGVFSAKLGAMLGRRMEDDHANGEPLSSALIVNRTSGMSSPGFFDKARSLGHVFKDEERFWQNQCDCCWSQGGEAMMSMIPAIGLTDSEQQKVDRLDVPLAESLINAGITDRPVWSADVVSGERRIRLLVRGRTVVELSEAEFDQISDRELLTGVRDGL